MDETTKTERLTEIGRLSVEAVDLHGAYQALAQVEGSTEAQFDAALAAAEGMDDKVYELIYAFIAKRGKKEN